MARVYLASELSIVIAPFHPLSNAIYTKRVMFICLSSKLTTRIVKGISENVVYLYFHITAVLLKAIRQFLKVTLKNAVVVWQLTVGQCDISVDGSLLCIIRNYVYESSFTFAINTADPKLLFLKLPQRRIFWKCGSDLLKGDTSVFFGHSCEGTESVLGVKIDTKVEWFVSGQSYNFVGYDVVLV